jgi:hypothetical protein
MPDTLLLASATPTGGMELYRVEVPDGLDAMDLYLQIVADIPAGEVQPVALNLTDADVAS